MLDVIGYILAGATVGFLVGLTGVGGGSLMTPLLLLFGIPPHIAIGTDLMYASLTKAGGVVSHSKRKTVDWALVRRLAIGSLPAAVGTIIVLKLFFTEPDAYEHILTSSLGVMLILTSLVLLFRKRLQAFSASSAGVGDGLIRHRGWLTTVMGVLLGVFVTLSSVGAGAFGAAIMLMLYPHLKSIKIVGSDIAHAVPLTLIAGLGHMYLGNVDYALLGCLLIGSLPAIHVGTKLATHLPDKVLHSGLASILLLIGVKYAFF